MFPLLVSDYFYTSLRSWNLLRRAKQLQAVDGPIKVCKVNGRVKELIEISGFDSSFVIHDHQASALAAFQQNPKRAISTQQCNRP